MTPSLKPLLLALAIVVMVISVSVYLYNQHTMNIKTKLEHQARYPYSCVVPDKLWDTCVTNEDDGYGAWTFANNQTCLKVYYRVTNWMNHQTFTTDPDGITHYKSEGYDSNGVWHQSSEWRECT